MSRGKKKNRPANPASFRANSVASKMSVSHSIAEVQEVLDSVQSKVTPVWPLADYVAVNPFAGFSSSPFYEANSELTALSAVELLMPLDYFRQRYREGRLTRESINTALDEMVADGVADVECLDINQILAVLNEPLEGNLHSEITDRSFTGGGRDLNTLVDYLDRYCNTQWAMTIGDELSKHCSSYYDAGQATWTSPEVSGSLYDNWRSTVQIDRNFELLGVAGFREFVRNLPGDPRVALHTLLEQLHVPESIWTDLLLCEALTLPGWSAWTRYQDQKKQQVGESGNDFASLLAMRLAYEVAVSRRFNFAINWNSMIEHSGLSLVESPETLQAGVIRLIRYVLLKASEINIRQRLLSGITSSAPTNSFATRPLSQMVFCIDVRSERIRRHLETTSRSIQTYGFAGFFGLPMEYVPMGEQHGHSCVPVLLMPKFKVREELDGPADSIQSSVAGNRQVRRYLRKLWQDFQTSTASCFTFVESLGFLYGAKLIARSLGFRSEPEGRFDGVTKKDQSYMGPVLCGLHEQGVTDSKQVELAESILKGIGIVEDFARLVVFCGHGSKGENNPLQAGLDCGACGGHTGEANARLAAKLLNQKSVRQGLAEKGIQIPKDTHFLAALHNTTTDELQFFDLHQMPVTHQRDLDELKLLAAKATEQTRRERQASLSSDSVADLLRRSQDWSEVRQEWGLAGNAAFIAGPREWTKSIVMDGRVFLHSYHHSSDPEFKVLEQIMTAPMVVAHWINMQYYASTVAPAYFGSGTKTIHNVVGKFGILSGSTGDLMTGLPWQSLHDGQSYQHEPLRLLAIIAAPREAINQVLAKHLAVEDTLRNDWMQLVAVEGSDCYRYTQSGEWEELGASEELIGKHEQLIPR